MIVEGEGEVVNAASGAVKEEFALSMDVKAMMMMMMMFPWKKKHLIRLNLMAGKYR